MCGIAGYLDLAGDRSLDINSMTQSLVHRGPDSGGVYQESGVGLGHRRLAILDLTSAGHQPMQSPCGSYHIVYNGEIYNYLELKKTLKDKGHTFYTGTDTEVVLAAYKEWGGECVKKFNGMWAFAIWNPKKRLLFCSRDRFGVKPFYYANVNGFFVFGSEPKAILAAIPSLRKPNYKVIHQFLLTGVTSDTPDSFYQEIHVLPPAYNALINARGMQIVRYWNYPELETDTYCDSDSAWTEQFREIFVDAVRLRARSDVEIGTTLSGGLDSTAIVAVFRNLFPHQSHRSYSATFTGENYDETEYIDAVADAYKVAQVKVAQSAGDLLADLKKLVWHLDSPLVSPAIVPLHRVLKVARANNTTVLYDGQGADEILAGYDNQFYPPYIHSLAKDVFKKEMGAELSTLYESLGSMDFNKLKWILRYVLPSLQKVYQSAINAKSVFTPSFRDISPNVIDIPKYYKDPLNQALYKSHSRSILPGLLNYGDAVSMASSIEYRLPFMDYRLVELAFQMPTKMKIRNGYTKYVLRQALDGVMIDKVRLRRWKNGFTTPMLSWIKERPNVIEEAFSSSSVLRHGIFSKKILDELVSDLPQMNEATGNYLFRWITTELWMRECIDNS